jgi:hypothetical protein
MKKGQAELILRQAQDDWLLKQKLRTLSRPEFFFGGHRPPLQGN